MVGESVSGGYPWETQKKTEWEYYENRCATIRDPVLFVLRAHLYSEHLLERIIASYLPEGQQLIDQKILGYFLKLSLVDSFGMIDAATISALRRLNTLRNSCAHNLEKTVELGDVDAIGEPFVDERRLFRAESGGNISAYLRHVVTHVLARLGAYTYLVESRKGKKPAN